jgi:hypothetical protein
MASESSSKSLPATVRKPIISVIGRLLRDRATDRAGGCKPKPPRTPCADDFGGQQSSSLGSLTFSQTKRGLPRDWESVDQAASANGGDGWEIDSMRRLPCSTGMTMRLLSMASGSLLEHELSAAARRDL